MGIYIKILYKSFFQITVIAYVTAYALFRTGACLNGKLQGSRATLSLHFLVMNVKQNFDTMGILLVQTLHLECLFRVDAGVYTTKGPHRQVNANNCGTRSFVKNNDFS